MEPEKIAEFEYDGQKLDVLRGQYTRGSGTAVIVQTKDGEPYATLSVMLQDVAVPPAGQFYLKDWSENERIAKAFVESGLVEKVEDPEQTAQAGFVVAGLYRLRGAVAA